MKPSLAQQQTDFLDLLRLDAMQSGAFNLYLARAECQIESSSLGRVQRGLSAYRANAQALAERSLAACYPKLQALIGEANLARIAADLWRAHPPVRGDLAQWGAGLAAFLHELPQLHELLAEHPYLPDVAALEWLLHQAQSAADAALAAESFQWLAEHDPQCLALQFSAGCAVLRSAYPVCAIWQLHDARSRESHTAARQSISQAQAQTALVWRQGMRPCVRALPPAEAALIQSSLAGYSLSKAMDEALALDAQLDFGVWLQQAVQSGLLMGVHRLTH